MIKNTFGRKFKRDTNQRKDLFRSLISSLIFEERIKTTLQKAKAIKGDIDKLINKARQEEKKAAYLLQFHLSVAAIAKIIKDIAPRFKDRNSGYTKLVKLGRRFSDNAEMVLMEWAVKKVKSEKSKVKSDEEKLDEKTAITETQKKRSAKK